MRYSFNPRKLNNLKARIAETLVECYIKEAVVPTLKKKGWDDVVHTNAWYRTKGGEIRTFARSSSAEYLNKIEERILVGSGFYPTRRFLTNFKRLTSLLEIVPDGFLIKLKTTGNFKPFEETVEEFGLKCENVALSRYLLSDFYGLSHHRDEMLKLSFLKFTGKLPMVSGEIEVVEVKSGKATLKLDQRRNYLNAIRSGYPLRFFNVEMISFLGNEFEVREKVIENEEEMKNI